MAGLRLRADLRTVVIVFIPCSSSGGKSERESSEWLPRQCPACGELAINGNGRRSRYALDQDHDRIRVRRGRCRRCNRSITVLPRYCIPGACYSIVARQQALRRVADGMTIEQAAPNCLDPNRIADPTTLRRWCRRYLESLVFVLYRVATCFSWDWKVVSRILIPKAIGP